MAFGSSSCSIRNRSSTKVCAWTLRLSGVKAGLLMNFNVTKLKSGIKRFIL